MRTGLVSRRKRVGGDFEHAPAQLSEQEKDKLGLEGNRPKK
jgi:hypothetical protein